MTFFSTEFWFISFILCLFSELTSPGLFYFLSPSVGALGASLCAWYGHSDYEQLALFVGLSILTFIILHRFLRAPHKKDKHMPMNADALVGKMGIVTESTVEFVALVKIGSEVWRARTKDDVILQQGERVVVSDVVGATLIVLKE